MGFTNMDSSRRELLLRLAALPAGAHFLAEWLHAASPHQHSSGSPAPPQSSFLRDYQPAFFAPPDFAALQAFTEILIPSDDTPGAREAYCAHFIDFLLQSAGDVPKLQQAWRSALAALREAGFHAADSHGRAALVDAISQPERDPSVHHPAYFAYRLIKQENAFAFYTSRVGIIEVLNYKGNSYNASFPACHHPEHQVL